MKSYRLARVCEVIREVASETILFRLKDPRVKGVTVTRAEVSSDLRYARVFVTIMGTPAEQTLSLHGLKHAAGFIQSRLADRLQTRTTPIVRFEIDKGVKNSIEVSRILNEALGSSRPPAASADGESKREDREEEPPSDAADGSADATSD
jgi:ribosome-binding factor A